MKNRTEQAAEIKVRRRGGWARVYAEAGEKDVSHLFYGPKRLRMGRKAVIRMAGIGGVGTEREFRRKGLAQRVFARAMEEMGRDEYSCVGLYTSSRLVAHRLYRILGLVDVIRQRRGYKVLDTKRFVCEALSQMLRLRDPLPEDKELAARRPAVRLSLLPYRPVCVRLEEGGVRALARAPRQIDLSLTMSSETFIALWRQCVTFRYAEEANLLGWQGDDGIYQQLGRALARWRKPVNEE